MCFVNMKLKKTCNHDSWFRSLGKRFTEAVFYKKGVLKYFAKFTGKHLCQGLYFNKGARLRPASLFKKETLVQVFSCEFCEIFENTFFIEHLRWLLLVLKIFTTFINVLYQKLRINL